MTTFKTLTDVIDETAHDIDEHIANCDDPNGLDLADMLDTIRAARYTLVEIEHRVEVAAAQAMLANTAENDRIRVERSRRPDRKSWQHAEWQAEVRRKVIQSHGLKGAHVISRDGEDMDLSIEAVIRQVQEVHGSIAPRATGLRALGIDPDDYAERSPGTWRVEVTRLAD